MPSRIRIAIGGPRLGHFSGSGVVQYLAAHGNPTWTPKNVNVPLWQKFVEWFEMSGFPADVQMYVVREHRETKRPFSISREWAYDGFANMPRKKILKGKPTLQPIPIDVPIPPPQQEFPWEQIRVAVGDAVPPVEHVWANPIYTPAPDINERALEERRANGFNAALRRWQRDNTPPQE